MKKFIILFFTLVIFSARAEYDLSTTFGFRSYALGTAARVDVGISQEFWRFNDQLYGFIRESAYFNTSALINSAGVRVDFFPVSILGFVAGTERVYRSTKELDTFDCDVLVCDEDGNRSYLRVENVLAYKKIVLINDYQREFYDYDSQGTFANGLHTLEVDSQEIVNVMRNVLAYQYSDKYTVGIIQFRTWTEKTRQDSTYLGMLNQYTKDKWTYGVVLGNYHSRNNDDHFSMLLQVKYDYKKGLRLF